MVRTVRWSRQIAWVVCGLSACATSAPERGVQTPRKAVASNDDVVFPPTRGTLTVNTGRHTCLIDADAPAADRQAVEAAALSFVNAALGPNPTDAYEMMTPAGRGAGSPEAFRAVIQATGSAGSFQNVGWVHTYWVESDGEGAAETAVCGRLKGRQWVTVEVKPERKQAYVAISARTINNEWRLTVWLLPHEGKWAVQTFHIGTESVAGRSADDVLTLARRERDTGHDLNAAALYVVLRSLVNRGPNFHLAIEQEAAKDFEKLQVPLELRGTPPFTWRLNGKEYTLDGFTITGVQGKLGLVFVVPLTVWTGREAADKSNREFITNFIAAHPDYSRVFEFLVARALKPDKSGGFGTVYQVGTGFE